ncbi:MAG TPA: conjugative transposon protein TraN [Puia sp.]|nr:conjugative transposon protein TraN [Puia sp.]
MNSNEFRNSHAQLKVALLAGKFGAVLLTFFCFFANAQTTIGSYSISVCFQKTTNLIFPYNIQKADIGSADVIGHKDAKLDNVLFLKANRKGFVATNLSVYTADGKFYSFVVQYKDNPDTLNISFINAVQNSCPISQFSAISQISRPTALDLDSDAILIKSEPGFMSRKTHYLQMKLKLRGIYIKDNLLWFKLRIINSSAVGYNLESFRIYVRDKHTSKRTAVQENEMIQAYADFAKCIEGETNRELVFAVKGFTISKTKIFFIELREQNGSRNLILPIKSKLLLKARSAVGHQ